MTIPSAPDTTGLGYEPAAWETFALAEVGAAAALAGLLVVAASINIREIVELPGVANRLGGTLASFTGVLAMATTVLVPGLDRVAVGVVISALAATVAVLVVVFRGLPGTDAPYRRSTLVTDIAALISALLLLWAGVSCAVGVGGGLYWLAVGAVGAFAVGLFNAWVALVEILRRLTRIL